MASTAFFTHSTRSVPFRSGTTKIVKKIMSTSLRQNSTCSVGKNAARWDGGGLGRGKGYGLPQVCALVRRSVIPSLSRDLGSAEKRTSSLRPTALPRSFDSALSRSAQDDRSGDCTDSPEYGGGCSPGSARGAGVVAPYDAPSKAERRAGTCAPPVHRQRMRRPTGGRPTAGMVRDRPRLAMKSVRSDTDYRSSTGM